MTRSIPITIDLQSETAETNSSSYPGLIKDDHNPFRAIRTPLATGLLLSLLTHPTNPSIAYEKREETEVIKNTTCENLHLLSSYITDCEDSIFEDNAPLEVKKFKTIKVSIKTIKPLLFAPTENEFDYA